MFTQEGMVYKNRWRLRSPGVRARGPLSSHEASPGVLRESAYETEVGLEKRMAWEQLTEPARWWRRLLDLHACDIVGVAACHILAGLLPSEQ